MSLPPPTARFNSGVPGLQMPMQNGTTGASYLSNKLGTHIAPNGEVVVRALVPDMEAAFQAVRDTVRCLSALYPEYSAPALVSGIAFAPGAKYKLEHFERKKIEHLDSTEREINIKRKKFVTIKEIIDEERFKIISFEVDHTVEGDIPTEVFPPTTFISIDINPYPQDVNEVQLSLVMDGGPPDIETTYCCLCIANPGSMSMQQESQEMRPAVYKQCSNFVDYVKSYDPNTSLAQQVSSAHSPVRRKHSQNSHVTSHSKSPKTTFSQSRSPFQSSSQVLLQQQQQQQQIQQSPFVRPLPSINANSSSFNSSYNNNSNQKVPPSPITKYGSPVMMTRKVSNISSSNMAVKTPYGKPPLPPKLEDNVSLTQLHQSQGLTTHVDEIKKLFDLFQMGALTQDEFEAEKKKLMNQRNTINF